MKYYVDPEEEFSATELIDLWMNIPDALNPIYKVWVLIDSETDPRGRYVVMIPIEEEGSS